MSSYESANTSSTSPLTPEMVQQIIQSFSAEGLPGSVNMGGSWEGVLMMHRISRNIPQAAWSLTAVLNRALSIGLNEQAMHCFVTKYPRHHHQRQQQEQKIPGDFVKWGTLGFFRGSKFASGFTPLQSKSLDSIIDIERAKSCSPEDLIAIWDDYHLGRGHISASMKINLYHLLEQRAMPCQHFVIPLWRGSGYTTMFIQVQMPHILFTGLEDYKARGTQAAPYFTATYYKEFAESKDVVLIHGDVVFTSKLEDSEASWLLETAQSFYLNDGWYKLVERFNKETHEFEFRDVLKVLDMPMG